MDKRCIKCGETKPLEMFSRNKAMRKDGRINKCKVCEKADGKEWAEKNPERRRETAREWARRNRESQSEYGKNWLKQNPHKSMEYYRNRVADPEKHAGILKVMADRYARQKQAIPEWAEHFLIREIYELASLRTKLTGIKWHVDHIVPIKSAYVCGLHNWNNLQVIPAGVNRKKNNVSWPDMPEGLSHRGKHTFAEVA